MEEAREGNLLLIVKRKSSFTGGNGFLVSCLRKMLEGKKHLIRCVLRRESVFLAEGYFSLFQL